MRGQEMENMTTMAKINIILAYCCPNLNSYLIAFLIAGVSALLRDMQICIKYQNRSGNMINSNPEPIIAAVVT